MRRRTLWIGLAVLWLVPATFVAVYDPGEDPASDQAAVPGPGDGARGSSNGQFFLFAHGYSKEWTVETWEGAAANADKTSQSYLVRRSPLNRADGTFHFRLSCTLNHARDLEGVRLFVTDVWNWDHDDAGTWNRVAESTVRERGADKVSLTCEAAVPGSTTAYRFVQVRGGIECCGFSQSMLTAPTFLGRVYDRIAPWPLFRWVPDLR